MLFSNLSIKFKIFLGYLSLSPIVVTILSTFNYQSSSVRLEKQLASRLKSIGSTASILIEAEAHNNIVINYLEGKKDLHQTPDFKKIQSILKEIQKRNNLTSDIYTLIAPEWSEGKMIFMTMANEKTYIGNSLPLNDHIKEVYQTKKSVTTKLYKDPEGEWLSSATPILDQEQNIVAVLQVDYNAQVEITQAYREMYKEFWVNISLSLLISFLISLFIKYIVIKPLKNITDEASQIFNNNFEITLSGENIKGEIGILAKSFNLIIKKIRDYTQNLENMIDERTSQIKALQKQLVSKAYTQGQAENAIGILHNLGNLITPAMTRISLEDDLESLELTSKAVQGITLHLREIEPSIEDNDPLKENISIVIEALDELKLEIKENTQFIQYNKGNIKKTIEKIAEVISDQQKYAHLSEKSITTTPLKEIVKDVLSNHQSSIEQKKIQVKKDFQTDPQINIDKYRFSNVINNFLTNAIEAIEEKSKNKPNYNERIIHIAIIENKKESKASLIFEDNGIGFDDQLASKIFDFGFSTKNRTSELGLHNCANFIRSYQGTLTINSPGPNQGAQVLVTLPTLPIQKDKTAA